MVTFYLHLQRPWHEYEHNFQIMYKVGMGHKPPIPEKLSTEGKDFLGHCLESEPKRRWTASMLLDHPFVKVRDAVVSETSCNHMDTSPMLKLCLKQTVSCLVLLQSPIIKLPSLVCFRFVRMKSEWNILKFTNYGTTVHADDKRTVGVEKKSYS